MKKLAITIVNLLLFGTVVLAENSQTVTIGGNVINKYATRLTFNDDNVVITFEDGTTQTADMETVTVSLAYDGDASGITTVTSDDINDSKVYSLSGQYVGNGKEKLSKGIYIIKGKKVVVK